MMSKAEMVREIRRGVGAFPPNQIEYRPVRWPHPYRWFGWLLPASWVARRYQREELVMTLDDIGYRAEP